MIGKTNVGGAPLAYKLIQVPGAFPAGVPENTVGVKTSTPFGKHTISPYEPVGRVNGDIWINTKFPGKYGFPIVKNRDVFVYPQGAYQYINGWNPVQCKIFQGGSWKEFFTFLFSDGDQNLALTGGWKTFSYPKLTFPGLAMRCVCEGNNAKGTLYTDARIDLTRFKKIRFYLSEFQTAGSGTYGPSYISFILADQSLSGNFVKKADINAGWNEIDISDINEALFVGFYFFNQNDNPSYTRLQIENKDSLPGFYLVE